jgi:NitT/TauT family transport system substrate-binding protein
MSVLSRRLFIAGGAAILAARPRTASAQTPQKIRLAGVPTEDLTPVYYAVKNGLYEKAGLDVEVVPTSSGGVATEAVIAGAYELGKGSAIAALLAHLKGLPITIVGNGNTWDPKSPFSLMVVPSDSTVKTGADLNGMTLASSALNDLNVLAMSAWIDKTGGDSKTVKWVQVPNSAGAAALAQHRIAATMLMEPDLSAALASGAVRTLTPAYNAISEHFATTVFFAQPEWAAAHGPQLDAWARVTYAAAAYTNTHHAETAQMMSDITKIPIESFTKMARSIASLNGSSSALQPVIDMAAKYKAITRAFPAKEAYLRG